MYFDYNYMEIAERWHIWQVSADLAFAQLICSVITATLTLVQRPCILLNFHHKTPPMVYKEFTIQQQYLKRFVMLWYDKYRAKRWFYHRAK